MKYYGVDEFEFKFLNFSAGIDLNRVKPGAIPFWTCKTVMCWYQLANCCQWHGIEEEEKKDQVIDWPNENKMRDWWSNDRTNEWSILRDRIIPNDW